ncbi:MAG: polysaccharide biosynthesis tyrosine autokinase [Nitrospirae bacterium]|nr:polysaccharide biosynthesis tyrosine autokinase [Nitrospirota bacterium]
MQKQMLLHDYIRVILRQRWVILCFFSIFVTAVFIGSIKQTPVYRAVSILLIEPISPRVISVQEVTPINTGDSYAYKDYYQTQYKLITGKEVLRSVSGLLGPEGKNPERDKYSAEKLIKMIKVSPVKNSQLVEIGVEDTDAGTAAKIANSVAEEYIRQNLERNVKASNSAAEWLSKKIEEQRQKLKDAEAALQEYRARYNINILPQEKGESAAEDIKAQYAQLQALFANYSQRYTEEHPKLVELKAQISSLKNKIHGLEDSDKGNQALEYRVLEREMQSNKRMYELLMERLKEIDLSSTLNVNNISVVERAEAPAKPIRPDLKLNTLIAVVLGLIIGVGFGFFVDRLDSTIKSPQDVEQVLESRFLGGIPGEKGKDERKKGMMLHIQPLATFSEAYRTIRTELINALLKDGLSSVLITSAEPKAGKTMTSANISIALAQTGSKVLLIDGDLRKPQIHKIFNVDRKSGLADYLTEGSNLSQLIKDTEVENLKVITAGKPPVNPSELISSGAMKELFNYVKQSFDFILIDSSPVASVTDAVIIADMVDASVLVVRSGKAFIPTVTMVKEKLENSNSKLLGTILNDLSTYNDNYYSYRYYRYYGEEMKKRRVKSRTS